MERRSIYRDIVDINKVLWTMENTDSTIEDAKEAIAADEYDTEKIVIYDMCRKGFMCVNDICKPRVNFRPAGWTNAASCVIIPSGARVRQTPCPRFFQLRQQ